MTRLFAILAALCLVQFAIAADIQGDGETILKPTTSGNSAAGVTVLTPSGAAPAPTATAPVTPPPAGMKAAIVLHPKSDCGCQQEAECECNKPKFVEPEIKPEHSDCACAGEESCGCHQKSTATVAPEQAPAHVEPEVVEKINHPSPCVSDCEKKQPEFVQPEIKVECGCADKANEECACSHFKPNF